MRNILSYHKKSQERTLRDETIASQSTAGTGQGIVSTNGKLFRPAYGFGGGNGKFTIGNSDGYTCFIINSSHGNIYIGASPTDYNELMTHEKIKIVTDAWNFGTLPSMYSNNLHMCCFGFMYNYSTHWNDVVTQNSFNIEGNTWYSSEIIVDTATAHCDITITKISDGTIQTGSWEGGWRIEPSTSSYALNGGGAIFWGGSTDNSGGLVRFADFHIYYK